MMKRLAIAAAAALLSFAAHAQTPPAPGNSQQDREAALRAAWQSAAQVAKAGPAKIELLEQGTIDLPNDIVYIPQPQAGALMRAMGNTTSPSLVGLITAKAKDSNWIATVSFIKEGYIKDDDAKEWNASDLLQNLKDGTEAANKQRRERGFPALLIDGWIESPAYDSETHRLVWSIGAHSEGSASDAPKTVNYNTYQLGREGYFSLNMLTDTNGVSTDKVVAKTLLANLAYNTGKDYTDFNPSTDKVAAYGLAALVGGAVLKKAGFFALILALLAKFWKIAAIGVVAAGYGLKNVVSRKKDSA